MYNETKVLLTIELDGGSLHRSETPEVREYILRKKDLFPSQKFRGDEGNKIIRKKKYTIYPLIPSTSTMSIKLCKEAYENMTSTTCPEWYRDVKLWRKLSEKARLEINLARTCEHFRGKSFTYKVIDD